MKMLYIVSVWAGTKEPNMHSDFVNAAAKAGHAVTVLALSEKRNGIPSSYQCLDGIHYLTIQCGNIQKTNKYQKVISSVLSNFQILQGARKYLKQETFDVVIWAMSSTLMYYAVHRLAVRFHAPEYLLLKEYWPQDPVDLGAMREGGMIYRVFQFVEKRMMDQADYIGVSSRAAIQYVNDRYPSNTAKCEVCPHCELPRAVDKSRREEVLKKYGIPADKKIFLYGGNFGVSQGIDDMVACIQAASEKKDVFFALLGSGTEYAKAKNALAGMENVRFYPGIRYNPFLELASVCDCGLIFLYRGYHVPNIPGKLNTYLNAELPIIACVDRTTDAGDIIAEGGAGIKVPSGDTEAFCRAVAQLCNPDTQRTMARNAKKLLCEGYTPERVLQTIEAHFQSFEA